MATISGIVSDTRNRSVSNASVLLIGEDMVLQTAKTDREGGFFFEVETTGRYKLSVTDHDSVDVRDVDIPELTTHVVILLRVAALPFTWGFLGYVGWDRFILLKYGQYIFLGIIGWFFFDQLVAERLPFLSLQKLNDIETARGAITYLITVTTLSMAALLMLAVIMTGGKDLDKRFALGKEIFTMLVGVLGTIVGFYFGTSDKGELEVSNRSVSVDTLRVSRRPDRIIVSGRITGGEPPFVYSINSDKPKSIGNIRERFSAAGDILDTMLIFDKATLYGESVSISIKGVDRKNTSFEHQQLSKDMTDNLND
ncbi:MAG: hypothetical protein BGO21_26365 [Dyadobacter sp. 50-39]|nr:MAG: hypothetical protein BGO21_26365 [Dyadobacter sp. 50-39]